MVFDHSGKQGYSLKDEEGGERSSFEQKSGWIVKIYR